jgi:beta-lactamase regulating signal transducer with metallopeptidase domain
VEAIANWVWQGSAVTLVMTLGLRLARRTSATTRHRLWWTTLIVVMTLPLAPSVWTFVAGPGADQPSPLSPPVALTVTLPAVPWWPVALAAALWAAWIGYGFWRVAGALIMLRRTKRTAVAFPRERETQLAGWTAVRDSGRRARLVISDRIRSAAVLGLGAPSIAVSPSVLDALSDRELDQILVHEWAHVQRRDDVARFLQVIVSALAGLHPAVWWIERQLHVSREDACDDWTINITGSARRYAACLTKLASLPNVAGDEALLPAALCPSNLTRRIMSLLDGRRNTSTRRTLVLPALITVALGSVAVIATSVELVAAPAIALALPVVSRDSLEAARSSAVPATDVSESPGAVVRSSRTAPRTERGRAAQLDRQAPPAVRTTGDGERAPKSRGSAGTKPSDTPLPGIAETPTTLLPGATSEPPAVASSTGNETTRQPNAGDEPQTPWGAAADAGVSVGRGSKKAAAATAGFFTRLGKSISGSFQ